MRNLLIAILCLTTLHLFGQPDQDTIDQPELENIHDSLNYFLGLNFGFSMQSAPWKADAALISKGLAEAMGGNSEYDQQTCNAIFQSLNRIISQEAENVMDSAAAENLEKGAAFLTENGKREGVTTTQSGLQYEVLTEGNGPQPADTSIVNVHYEGTLIDGTVFDSSYERDESVSFPLNRVIPGWTEGVQLMPLGSTYKIYIPSNLAYGPRGTSSIPANSVLVFKIELLGIE